MMTGRSTWGASYEYDEYLELMDRGKIYLGDVPFDYRTEEMCDMAIGEYPRDFKHVPDSLKTEKRCRFIVRCDGAVLEFIPDKFVDADLVQDAFASSCQAFPHVRDDLKTYKMSMAAVKYRGAFLERVLAEHLDEKICLAAMKPCFRVRAEEVSSSATMLDRRQQGH